MNDAQLQELMLKIDSLKRPTTLRTTVGWVKFVGPAVTVLGLIGAVLVSYVFVTKTEANEKHAEIIAKSSLTYERKDNAGEIHRRQDKESDMQKAKLDMIIANQHKLDMILHNSYEAARASGVSRRRLMRVEED